MPRGGAGVARHAGRSRVARRAGGHATHAARSCGADRTGAERTRRDRSGWRGARPIGSAAGAATKSAGSGGRAGRRRTRLSAHRTSGPRLCCSPNASGRACSSSGSTDWSRVSLRGWPRRTGGACRRRGFSPSWPAAAAASVSPPRRAREYWRSVLSCSSACVASRTAWCRCAAIVTGSSSVMRRSSAA